MQNIAEISQPPETETWHAWQGSMMAQAGRDPLFFAALDVANAGAANAGEYCLRCHMPSGWLKGRSSTPDGSEMEGQDREGISAPSATAWSIRREVRKTLRMMRRFSPIWNCLLLRLAVARWSSILKITAAVLLT